MKFWIGIFCMSVFLIGCGDNQHAVNHGKQAGQPRVNNSQYINQLNCVLGDVKQAQIKNLLRSTNDVDNLLDGFDKLEVTGIRIAIFSDGQNPNETIYNYLFTQARKRDIKIFANPALFSGGQRIANGTLTEKGGRVKNLTSKSLSLVTRIKAFAKDYPSDWISPFNEDGEPGNRWSADQISDIYNQLHGQVNSAKLIGPCTFGIPAGVRVLTSTGIKNYIEIATTHNLGFNHKAWPDFIDAAGSLEVWDSETNNNKKFKDKATRIDAAVEAGVSGLVLYDSWRTIDLMTGELKQSGLDLKTKYMK